MCRYTGCTALASLKKVTFVKFKYLRFKLLKYKENINPLLPRFCTHSAPLETRFFFANRPTHFQINQSNCTWTSIYGSLKSPRARFYILRLWYWGYLKSFIAKRVISMKNVWSNLNIWDLSCWNIKKILRQFMMLLIITSKTYLYI